MCTCESEDLGMTSTILLIVSTGLLTWCHHAYPQERGRSKIARPSATRILPPTLCTKEDILQELLTGLELY